jgi:methyl-accepting chemotaxis protein
MSATKKSAGASSSVFSNMKLKTKVLLGFSSVLALVGILGGTGYYSLTKVGGETQVYGHSQDIEVTAVAIERDVAVLRRQAREFLNTGSEDALAKFPDAKAALEATLQQADGRIQDADDRRKLQELVNGYKEYLDGFQKAIDLKHEQKKLIEETLDKVGPATAADLEKLATDAAHAGNGDASVLANAALLNVMKARLYVNIVIGRHDAAAQAKADKAFEDLATVMAQLAKSAAGSSLAGAVDEINASVDTYHKAVVRSGEITVSAEDLTNKVLPAIAGKFNDLAEEISKTASGDAAISPGDVHRGDKRHRPRLRACLAHRPRDRHADHSHDRRHEQALGWRQRGRGAGAGPQGRNRDDGQRRPGLQEQRHREAPPRRADQGG